MTRTVNMPDSVSIALSKLYPFVTKAFWVGLFLSISISATIYVLIFLVFILNILGIPYTLP